MEEIVSNQYLRFEYVDPLGYKTVVEKEFDEFDNQFNDLLEQIRYALLACGFSEGLVSQGINLPE